MEIDPGDVIRRIVDDKEWNGPFYFIQGADCQFGLIDRYILKKATPNWDKEIELSKKCVKLINSLEPKPKFFIICGDMLDAYPQDLKVRKEQERDFLKIYNEIDKSIPLVCVCGNHDVGESPTQETVESYRSTFGNDFFSFWVGGVLFIVINTQYYVDYENIPELRKEQDIFISRALKDSSKSKVGAVIFHHIPPFIVDANETDTGYFSIKPSERHALLNKYAAEGVRYIFSGHYHRNAGGRYKNIESVVTSAIGGQLGNDESGFRIVKVKESGIEHEYYSFDEVPKNITL